MVFFSAIPENFHVMNQLMRNSRMGARAYYAEKILAATAWLCTFVLVIEYQSGNVDSTALVVWVYILPIIIAIQQVLFLTSNKK